MKKGKYIIIDGICPQAVLFCATMNHSDFLQMVHRDCILSAGFFFVDTLHDGSIEVKAYGESVSLGIKSKKTDAWLIKRILGE